MSPHLFAGPWQDEMASTKSSQVALSAAGA